MADIITTKLAVTKLKRKKRLLLNELYRQFIEGEVDPKKRIKRDNDTSRSAVDGLTGMKINENEEFDEHNGVISAAASSAVDDVEGAGVGGSGGGEIVKPKAKRAPRKPKAKEESKVEAENKTSEEAVEEEGAADILDSNCNSSSISNINNSNDNNSNSNSNSNNNNDDNNDS